MDMLKKYEVVAEQYIERMKQDERVEGIMHLGGIARRRADEHSDIDITVFSKEPIKGLILGEQLTIEGYDLEVFNVVMNEGYDNWNPIKKEAYEEGFIAFDRNGLVKDFITKALEYKEDFRIHYMATLIFKIAWHGWIYTPFRNKHMKGYNWILPEDLWFQRGDEANAYYIAQVCVDDFLELLFVINRKWTPDYKWRLIKSRKLSILPTDYEKKISYLLLEAWNKDTWCRKREVFQQMIDEMISKIIDDMPEDWYKIIE